MMPTFRWYSVGGRVVYALSVETGSYFFLHMTLYADIVGRVVYHTKDRV